MFRKRTLACVLFLLALFASGTAWGKPRIAILEFEDKSGAGAPGEAVADMLTTENSLIPVILLSLNGSVSTISFRNRVLHPMDM